MTKQTKAYIALLFVCIVWGTTYLALRIGVQHYPAFLFAGIRQTIAGIILGGIALIVNKKVDLSLKNILHQLLVGFLLLTIGNGMVTWGERFVTSGVAALICSMMPIFAVSFNLLSSRSERFNSSIIAGMVLGICGVGLIFKNDIADLTNGNYLLGMGAILLATCSWALGSVLNKRKKVSVNPMFNSAMQLFFGGIIMLAGSPLIDDYTNMQLGNKDAIAALVYLIIFGSVLAYSAYMYVLNALPMGIATIYAYINPLVAVLLGYLILKEPLTVYTLLAFITIIAGVYLVNKGYRKQHKNLSAE
ncbi:MAG: EamA family transporter [Taibaiella sp.]|nr:EamA family transporter [Taibaiella sp.]